MFSAARLLTCSAFARAVGATPAEATPDSTSAILRDSQVPRLPARPAVARATYRRDRDAPASRFHDVRRSFEAGGMSTRRHAPSAGLRAVGGHESRAGPQSNERPRPSLLDALRPVEEAPTRGGAPSGQ